MEVNNVHIIEESEDLGLTAFVRRPGAAEGRRTSAAVDIDDFGMEKAVECLLFRLARDQLAVGRLDQAEQNVQRSLQMIAEHGLKVRTWKRFELLAEIAERRNRSDEARRWRHRQRACYAAHIRNIRGNRRKDRRHRLRSSIR